MIAFVFDTETTALIENRTVRDEMLPEVIEFYGCVADLSSGEILNQVEYLIKPRRPVPELVTKITGLTTEQLASAPSWAEVFPSIRELIEASEAVIAHNLSFDKEVVDIECGRIGATVRWPVDLICTVEQSLHIKGIRLSMTHLHEYLFGEGFEGAHRARTDTMALLRCSTEMFKRGWL